MAHNPSSSFEMLRLNPGLATDPASGRAGELYYNNVSNTMRYFDGSLWTDFGGTWATQALDNLTVTAINADLNPDTTLARSLGTSSLVWNALSVQGINQVTTISDLLGSGIQISSQTTTGATNSGPLSMITGDSVNGATGGILIRSGSPTGGTTVFKQQIGSFAATAFNFDTTAIGTKLAGVQLVAPTNGVLSSLVFKLQNATATPDTYSAQLFVYSDSAGSPGTVITSSTLQSIPIAGSTSLDYTFTFQAPVTVVSGQTYYFILAAQSVASTLNLLGSASSVSADNFTSSTNSGGSWTTTAFPDPYYILYNSPTRGTVDIDGGVTRLMNQSALRFMNPGSTNYVAFKAPSTIPTNFTLTLPSADGTSGQALVTNGSGLLSFSTVTTPPSGAAGSIQFTNGSAFASDNANLFWDDALNRLGVGTNAPTMSLDVLTSANNVATFRTTAASGQVNNIILDSNANTGMIIRNNVSTSGMYIGNSGGNTKDYQISNTEATGGSLILRNHAINQIVLNSSDQLKLGAAGLIWPAVDGTNGQALTTNGSLTLSWTSVASATGTANTLAAYNSSGNLTASGPNYTASTNLLDFTRTTSGGRLQFGKLIPGGGVISATGDGSFAGGSLALNAAAEIVASGIGSFAFGSATSTGTIHASGSGAMAGGLSSVSGSITNLSAGGNGSFSWGRVTTSLIDHAASGASAFNTGEGNTTSGDDAASFGMGHLNGSYANFALGRWSVATGTAGSWVTTDPLFVVGIGASAASRANAFKIQKDGKLFILDPSLTGAAVGYTWTLQNATTGEGAWAASSAGANTSLSNLITTAINQDLVWAFTGGTTKTLRSANNGAASITGDNLLVKSGDTGGNNSPSGAATFKSGDAGNANSGAVTLASGTVLSNSSSSGAVLIASGNNGGSSTAGSGAVTLQSGTVGGAQTSGNISLITGTGGTRGSILFQESTLAAAVNGYIWTLADQTTGRGGWAALSAANQALSNLASTAVNVDINPGVDNSINLGSFTKRWAGVTAHDFFSGVSSQYVVVSGTAPTKPSGSPGGGALYKPFQGGGSGSLLAVFTDNNTDNTNPSGTLFLETGNNAGTAGTGGINLRTGVPASGPRGQISFADGTEGTAGYVWTSTDTQGHGAWLAPASGGSPTVEYRTLTSGEATANALTLTGTPATPSKTLVDIFSGGGPMEYTAEFTVSGTTLSWSGGVYAGFLVAGNRLRITYWP